MGQVLMDAEHTLSSETGPRAGEPVHPTGHPDPVALSPILHDKLAHLRRIIASYRRVLVAFSGGVDSALVLQIAAEQLGADAIALTAVSETMAAREIESAAHLARTLGVQHEQVRSNELARPGFAQNPTDRCYHCKTELFSHCSPVAERLHISAILLGTNLDDLSDHRPGLTAAREQGAKQPLVEAGLTKAEVRLLARHLGLSVWDKPQLACLSSRFPYGTHITPGRLRQVDGLEQALADLGFRQLRVRYHLIGTPAAASPTNTEVPPALARIELPQEDLSRALACKAQITQAAKSLGFAFVSLDLEGFRSGSNNLVLHTLGRSSSARPAPVPAAAAAVVAPEPAAVPSQPLATPPRPRKLVVAGIAQDKTGAVLISQRRADQAMPLFWEFPGGKVEPGELPQEALSRELSEELGVIATVGTVFDVIGHRYPDFDLVMLVYRCTFDRPPTPREVADVRWVSPADLATFRILPADEPLVQRLISEHSASAQPLAGRP